VRWTADGRELSRAFIDVPAGSAAETRLDRGTPERAVVAATIDDAAGYAADNVRYFVTDPRRPLPVLVVTSVDGPRDAALYVRAALEAAGNADASFAVTVVPADDRRLGDVAALRAGGPVVLVGTRGLGHAARQGIRDAVQAGRGLFIAAGPDVEPGVVRDLIGGDESFSDSAAEASGIEGLAATEARHPVLAALGDTAGNLGQVRVERAWTVRNLPAGSSTLLALTSGRAALAEIPVARGRVFLLATDLGRRWNTWPLHPTFMPFLAEAVRHLGGERTRSREVLVAGTGADDGARPGAITLAASGERVAVNVDPRESRVDALTPQEFVAGLERVAGTADRRRLQREAEQAQGLWRNVALALLLVLALEGVAAARSKTAVTGAAGAPPAADPIVAGERA
jgi:hypothetical protein